MLELNKIYCGDCLDVVTGFPDCSVDTIITDPPYGLKFMGKDWDHGVPGVHFWQEFLRVVKPGAYLLAFGGTRTHHRLMVAIEDAGWEIRDTLGWLYGSGFPKSLDVSKAIDKVSGVEREVIGMSDHKSGIADGNCGEQSRDTDFAWARGKSVAAHFPITAPATDAAKQWNGWGTALKPAYEIIILAQKPYQKEQHINIASLYLIEAKLWSLLPANVAEKNFGLDPVEFAEVFDSVQWDVEEKSNIQEGLFDQMDISQFVSVMTSCLNTVTLWRTTLGEFSNNAKTSTTSTEIDPTIDLKILNFCLSVLTPHTIIQDAIQTHGRWQHASPAVRYLNAVSQKLNATHTLSAPEIAMLQERIKHPEGTVVSNYPAWEPIVLARKPLDGTVAENVQKWGVGALNIDGCRVAVNPEVDDMLRATVRGKRITETWENGSGFKNESNSLTGVPSTGRFPANLIHDGSEEVMELFPESKCGAFNGHRNLPKCENTYNHFALKNEVGHPASSGSAARFFYCAKASKSERGEGNTHPTVKPQALLRYLIKLSSRENSVVLDPFMGSGSTCVACSSLGRNYIGIEKDTISFEIANQRLKGVTP